MADDDKVRVAQAAEQADAVHEQPKPEGRPLLVGGNDLPRPDLLKRPRGVMGKIKAERPAALPMPAHRKVEAFTRPEVFEKWTAEAAGIRAVEQGDNVITMFGPIGEDFWSGGGITAKTVTAQLRAIGARPIEVQINSPGGDMFEGIAIYNVLREHPQPVSVKVMGIAASAASVIAMSGDTVEIGAASFIMIHNCSVLAAGNRHDFAEVAAFLAPFDQAMADLYAQRTGQDAKAVAKWMDDETFMSGSVAIERGFADMMLSADKITTDEKTKASDQEVNKVRAVELRLVKGGDTRSQARAHIKDLRGTKDSAPPAGMSDSADTSWLGDAAELLAKLKS